jgi:hypothetical protein
MTRKSGFVVIIIASFLLAAPVFADSTPTLAITSPSNNAAVQPGQTVQILVNATNPELLKNEFILATTPLGASDLQPAESQNVFNLTMPDNIRPGRYLITANGQTVSGNIVKSVPVAIVVPWTAAFSALDVSPRSLALDYPGAQINLEVHGIINNRRVWINPDSLSYNSNNPAVASVNSVGIVTAHSKGIAQITVNYTYNNNTVSSVVNVQVSGTVSGDLNNDGTVDIDDVNTLAVWRNHPTNGLDDIRDLNHDGKIDAQDVAALESLCTFPNCDYRLPANRPPIANAGSNQTVECTGPTGANVSLNGTASSDPDDDPLTFAWTGSFGSVNGATPTVGLPLGQSVINLTVDDGHGATASAQVTDTVVDTTPPTVSAELVPLKQRGQFRVAYSCNDTCSANTTSSATIDGVSVTNGQTVILNVAKISKSGYRKGILYIQGPTFTLSASCTDQAGNTGTGTAKYP